MKPFTYSYVEGISQEGGEEHNGCVSEKKNSSSAKR